MQQSSLKAARILVAMKFPNNASTKDASNKEGRASNIGIDGGGYCIVAKVLL